jgi:hypothetical protein
MPHLPGAGLYRAVGPFVGEPGAFKQTAGEANSPIFFCYFLGLADRFWPQHRVVDTGAGFVEGAIPPGRGRGLGCTTASK